MRRVAFVLALFLLVPVLSACGEKGAVHSWRQKLVLDVETPTGPKSGGSVVAVDVAWYSGWEMAMSNGTGVASYSKGEASFVEIAPGKYLFALSVYEPMQRTLHAFVDAPEELRKEDGPRTITARLQSLRETRLVAREDYPVLVTFADVNDPKSVQLVDPANLATTFGPGVALKQITLEITNEKVTEGEVEEVLRWLGDIPERTLGRSKDIYKPIFAATIKHGDFIQIGVQ